MKKVLRKILSVLFLVGVVACIAFSIPNIIKMAKELSATPVPGEELTLAAACEFYGKVVEVEGRLELTNNITCSGEEPYTCRLELFDPYWKTSVFLTIPVYQGEGDPPANHMAKLPESFTNSDFYIRTADNLYARDGSFISVRGTESHSGSTCTISGIEAINMLDHLVIDVGVDPASLTLQEAITEGVVVATISGNGLSQINLSLKPNIDVNYEIEILPGTMFISATEGVQNMVVRQGQIVYLKPEMEISLELEVSCANMTLKEPSYADAFSVSTEPINEDLLRLIQSENFTYLDLTIQQFAIWTITDNPYDTNSYTGITIGNYKEKPNELMIKIMRGQFEQAGIDTTKYSVFNN
ncbi:MAG: hypothetical protein FP831_01475 [Anaerolineae bacterium]|nr:hypothetical protein [Anaerolineae bacterium]